MHDQLGMGIRDRGQHLQEDAQARAHVETLVRAVPVDRAAFDVFEREIGLALGRHARVVQPRNVRVRQSGEDVALPCQAFRERRPWPGAARQLQGDSAADQAVRTLGLPHGAHAAFAQLAQHPIRTDHHAGLVRRSLGTVAGGEIHRWNRAEKIGGLHRRRVGEERQQARFQGGVRGSQCGEPLRALGRGEIERLIEQVAQPNPCVGVHGGCC